MTLQNDSELQYHMCWARQNS